MTHPYQKPEEEQVYREHEFLAPQIDECRRCGGPAEDHRWTEVCDKCGKSMIVYGRSMHVCINKKKTNKS